MRVALDTRPAKDPRGIGRYVRCLHSALRATAAEDDELFEHHKPRRVDVFHSPWIDGASVRLRCPQVVTLHDLVPLKRRSEYLRTGLRFRLRYLAVQRAARVIVPTHAVKGDAIEHLGLDPDRIVVIAEAAAAVMHPRPDAEVLAVRERYGLPAEYLLWVGGLEFPDPRKRVADMACAKRTLPLVLAGPTRPWSEALGERDAGITLTGKVSDDELAALYTGAHALVFPSDDEGFGLPPVEALACGTPVVACDVPALREVLGDRATFVERGDLDGMFDKATAVRRPAPEPPAWTWDDAARSSWQVYRDAIAAGNA